jgi:hypothetical protein
LGTCAAIDELADAGQVPGNVAARSTLEPLGTIAAEVFAAALVDGAGVAIAAGCESPPIN